jgi:hypothetical protein
MIFDRNNIWIGLATGLLIPFIGYALLLALYEQLEAAGIGSSTGFSPDFRQRTIAVIAICLNVFPVNRFRRRRMTESMRGVVFATTAYVLLWVLYFANSLF